MAEEPNPPTGLYQSGQQVTQPLTGSAATPDKEAIGPVVEVYPGTPVEPDGVSLPGQHTDSPPAADHRKS